MFNILVDTCVWLDLAKDPDQQPLLAVLEELVTLKEVRLIVPRIVLNEFARNKARIVQESGRSMSAVFKRVKEAVSKHGDARKAKKALELLDDVDHKIPMLGDAANVSIGRIEKLLTSATVIETSESVKARAAQRAIDKVAPFHRQRNGIDDAILIEIYADEIGSPSAKGQRFAFVTHNVKDFSDPTGNNKTPHPNLASLFTKIKSRYFISLSEAAHSVRPDLVSELMLEHEGWVDEPRSLSEIVDALDEMVDKMWYDRHQVMAHRIAQGKHKRVDKETWENLKDYSGTTIKEVWEKGEKGARRLERKYGKETLGPWTDYEWGMLNGKVSALRWVLGEEWDMLDT